MDRLEFNLIEINYFCSSKMFINYLKIWIKFKKSKFAFFYLLSTKINNKIPS